MGDQHPTQRKQRGRGPAGRKRVACQADRVHGAQASSWEKRGWGGGRRQNAKGPVFLARATTLSCAQEDGREDRRALGDGRRLRGKRWGQLRCQEMTDCHVSGRGLAASEARCAGLATCAAATWASERQVNCLPLVKPPVSQPFHPTPRVSPGRGRVGCLVRLPEGGTKGQAIEPEGA